jgi:hypothetical protein
MFSADTPDGLLLRKAHQAVKEANFPSVVVAFPREVGKARDSGSVFDKLLNNDSESSAYDLLMEKANKLRQLEPELSPDQAFAKVYTDPRNANLAQQERTENRPGASTNYPYPGGKH